MKRPVDVDESGKEESRGNAAGRGKPGKSDAERAQKVGGGFLRLFRVGRGCFFREVRQGSASRRATTNASCSAVRAIL